MISVVLRVILYPDGTPKVQTGKVIRIKDDVGGFGSVIYGLE